MNARIIAAVLIIISVVGLSCTRESAEERYLNTFTDQFLADRVVPKTLDIAERAVAGLPLSTNLLRERRITQIELILAGKSAILYEDPSLSPPSRAMHTGLPHARLAGIYLPKDLDSPIVELRMNHDFGTNGFAAVHIVTERPTQAPEATR